MRYEKWEGKRHSGVGWRVPTLTLAQRRRQHDWLEQLQHQISTECPEKKMCVVSEGKSDGQGPSGVVGGSLTESFSNSPISIAGRRARASSE